MRCLVVNHVVIVVMESVGLMGRSDAWSPMVNGALNASQHHQRTDRICEHLKAREMPSATRAESERNRVKVRAERHATLNQEKIRALCGCEHGRYPMKKAAIILASVVALGATAVSAPAEARGWGRGWGPGPAIGFGLAAGALAAGAAGAYGPAYGYGPRYYGGPGYGGYYGPRYRPAYYGGYYGPRYGYGYGGPRYYRSYGHW